MSVKKKMTNEDIERRVEDIQRMWRELVADVRESRQEAWLLVDGVTSMDINMRDPYSRIHVQVR